MMHRNTCDMLDDILKDEYGAMSMYAGMAAECQNPTLRVLLGGIAADEYNHARIFTVWQELGCRPMPAPRPMPRPRPMPTEPPMAY